MSVLIKLSQNSQKKCCFLGWKTREENVGASEVMANSTKKITEEEFSFPWLRVKKSMMFWRWSLFKKLLKVWFMGLTIDGAWQEASSPTSQRKSEIQWPTAVRKHETVYVATTFQLSWLRKFRQHMIWSGSSSPTNTFGTEDKKSFTHNACMVLKTTPIFPTRPVAHKGSLLVEVR